MNTNFKCIKEVYECLEWLYNKRYILLGIYSPGSIKDRIIHLMIHTDIIKAGNKTEECLRKIIEKYTSFKWDNEPIEIRDENNNLKKIGQTDGVLVDNENKRICCFEIKLQDNHDNTKIDGQCDDCINKYKAFSEKYGPKGYNVTCGIWFVGNKRKHESVYKNKLKNVNGGVKYGREFFDAIFSRNDNKRDSAWEEFNSLMTPSHEDIDLDFEKYYNKLITYVKLTNNESKYHRIIDDIEFRPILNLISPNGVLLPKQENKQLKLFLYD